MSIERARPHWVPIRTLRPRHRARMVEHLLKLDEHDRHLRFGYQASDDHIRAYVAGIDFDRDEVFGIFDARLALIACVHLAYDAPVGTSAEFGVSVLPHVRGRGWGRQLFDHAVLHARNRGVERLVVHALTENVAMLRIARGAGAVVERHGPEAEACLRLPPQDWASHLDQAVEDGAAEFDYRWKVQMRRVQGWWAAWRGLLAPTSV